LGNWRIGDCKSGFRTNHRHRIEALDHKNGVTVTGGRDKRIVIEIEKTLESSVIDVDSVINDLQIFENIIICGTQDGDVLFYNMDTKTQLYKLSATNRTSVSYLLRDFFHNFSQQLKKVVNQIKNMKFT
jgi:hypothetical protein